MLSAAKHPFLNAPAMISKGTLRFPLAPLGFAQGDTLEKFDEGFASSLIIVSSLAAGQQYRDTTPDAGIIPRMDIFFHDPDDAPVPPDEVRIRAFTVTPYPDGRRIKIYLELTPFQERPSGEIAIQDLEGRLLATANIIETMTHKMELTLHLRGAPAASLLEATADIFYQTTPSEDMNGETDEYQLPERKRVDFNRITFTLETHSE